MMFKRRKRRPIGVWLLRVLWPRGGLMRAWRYIWHRLGRLKGSPHAIAAGFAAGAAVSFMPLVGLHFLLGLAVAWMLRSSMVASLFGTAVGNPWTFPFIWSGTYWIGSRMLGTENTLDEGSATAALLAQIKPAMMQLLLEFDSTMLREVVWPVWWPMMLGSLPVCVVVWLAFYIPLERAVAGYQVHRQKRRAAGLARRQQVLQD